MNTYYFRVSEGRTVVIGVTVTANSKEEALAKYESHEADIIYDDYGEVISSNIEDVPTLDEITELI
jgi:hypothetical protein